MKTKARLIHLIVTLLLAAAALGIGIAMNVYMNSFDHEQVAKKFSNGTRFAQITVFAPDTAGLTVDKIMYFRYKLETKLTEKSITPPNDGARLYADAFSSYVDASLASKGSRTSNVKLAYVGGDYSLFYKAYRDMPNVGNDINHDRILLSRSAAWQLYGGEALYDYPVKIGPATFYVSGVYPDYKESAYIKDFYGDKPAAAADIKSDAGINITCKTSAPFYVESADKVRITLEKGTDNVLTDASNYVLAAGVKKPNACLYSSDDLLIKGSGSLTVNANYNNGIGVKNDLKIKDGNITVNAPNNAIKGNGSITVEGGTINARGADGFKSDSIMEGKGFISILGGTISIVAGDDGLQAESAVTIAAGASVTINAADKDINCDGTVSVADNTLISK